MKEVILYVYGPLPLVQAGMSVLRNEGFSVNVSPSSASGSKTTYTNIIDLMHHIRKELTTNTSINVLVVD